MVPSTPAQDPVALFPFVGQHGDQLWAVTPLAGRDEQGQRPASAFAGEVDLAGQTAPGVSEPFVGAVLELPALHQAGPTAQRPV